MPGWLTSDVCTIASIVVPISGPKTVPSPPITSIVTSMLIGVRPMTDGEMLWLKLRYKAPAMPARKPEIANAITR